MAALVSWSMQFADWGAAGHKTVKALTLFGGIGGGVAVYLIIAHLLKCEEVHEAVDLFRRKVLRR
jgi:putative peptidoglycan lipid II flippase